MLKVCGQAEKDQIGEQLAAQSDTVEAKISQPVLSMTDQMREIKMELELFASKRKLAKKKPRK